MKEIIFCILSAALVVVCAVYVAPWLLPKVWKWISRGRKFLICALALTAVAAGPRIELVSLSTNRPDFDFTAAGGSTAYWHSSNYCWSATFAITGEPGVYDLQWDYDLLPRYTNWFSPSNYAIVGHGWLTVYPPITNTTGNVTVTYPAKPSPESYWRLKQRQQ